jgi:predicted transcriptional regulator
VATARKPAKKTPEVEPGSVDELTRIVAVALRYQGIPQGVLVHDLSDAGLPPARIATLLNTTSATVSQQKYLKRPVWPKKEA